MLYIIMLAVVFAPSDPDRPKRARLDDLADAGEVPVEADEVPAVEPRMLYRRSHRRSRSKSKTMLHNLIRDIIPPGRPDPFNEMMSILGVTRAVAVLEWIAANNFEYSRLEDRYLEDQSTASDLYELAVMYAHSLRVTNSNMFPLLPKTQDVEAYQLQRFTEIKDILSLVDSQFASKFATDHRPDNVRLRMLLAEVVLLMTTFPGLTPPLVLIAGSVDNSLKYDSFVEELFVRKRELLARAVLVKGVNGPNYSAPVAVVASDLERVLSLPVTDGVSPDQVSGDTVPEAAGAVPEGAPEGDQAGVFIDGEGEIGVITTPPPT